VVWIVGDGLIEGDGRVRLLIPDEDAIEFAGLIEGDGRVRLLIPDEDAIEFAGLIEGDGIFVDKGVLLLSGILLRVLSVLSGIVDGIQELITGETWLLTDSATSDKSMKDEVDSFVHSSAKFLHSSSNHSSA